MARFGERLRQLREAAGLSQEALARAAGLSTSTVVRTEHRDMDPSWSTVQALAAALSVDCTAFQDAPAAAGGPSGEKPTGKRKGRGEA